MSRDSKWLEKKYGVKSLDQLNLFGVIRSTKYGSSPTELEIRGNAGAPDRLRRDWQGTWLDRRRLALTWTAPVLTPATERPHRVMVEC